MLKSIPIDKYLELIKPEYSYIHVIPHRGVKGKASKSMARTIAYTYKSVERRIRKEQKKLFFETDFKISYIMDITKTNVSFYFVVPKPFEKTILTQIKDIWDKTTVEILPDKIKPFSDSCDSFELSYKKLDALSLDVNPQNFEPLSSILGVMEILQEDDRVGICYNFMPSTQKGWIEKYTEEMEKVKLNKTNKFEFTTTTILKNLFGIILSTADILINSISEFLVGDKAKEETSLYDIILGSFNDKVELTNQTKKKKQDTILQTQIAVFSDSKDKERQVENALSVCRSYRAIDGDNELKYKKFAPKNINFEKYSLGTKVSYFSTDEVSNFIQLPGRTLLDAYKIDHIKINETILPIELQNGYKRIGAVTYKGKETMAYFENEYNVGNLPVAFIGSQGSGKSTLFANCGYDAVKANESLFVIDFIKNCELSEAIESVVPKEKLVVIDLGSQHDIQGFGYNEIQIDDSMDDYTKTELSNLQVLQTLALVDSMNPSSPLTSRMRRFFSAAAGVVFIQKRTSLKDVITCLEDYKKREEFINNLTPAQKEYLAEDISTLEDLDEYSKGSKDEEPVKIGNASSKVDHILDRISVLREDFKLRFMYNKDISKNVDFVKCMDENKVVLIKMREADFPTKNQKNVLVTYFMSKLWLASQLRGSKTKEPSRCNVIVDELFQSPTAMGSLEYFIPQSRKFGLRLLLSMQYSSQLKPIMETLEASGTSFFLLTGCTQDDFDKFKDKMPNFTFEDLRDMPRFHAMCLVSYSGGYSSFIAKLPPPVNK